MSNQQNYVVEMRLNPVPPDAYQELGRAEMEYTQEQIGQRQTNAAAGDEGSSTVLDGVCG